MCLLTYNQPKLGGAFIKRCSSFLTTARKQKTGEPKKGSRRKQLATTVNQTGDVDMKEHGSERLGPFTGIKECHVYSDNEKKSHILKGCRPWDAANSVLQNGRNRPRE